MLQALQHVSLDFFAWDACHTKHHIAKGMQMHILAVRTGNNRVLIPCWSLDSTESNESYAWFADQCDMAGFGELTKPEPGPLKRTPVGYHDGMKVCVLTRAHMRSDGPAFSHAFARLRSHACSHAK